MPATLGSRMAWRMASRAAIALCWLGSALIAAHARVFTPEPPLESWRGHPAIVPRAAGHGEDTVGVSYNVQTDFGAKGDGTTNDTLAFRAGLAACARAGRPDARCELVVSLMTVRLAESSTPPHTLRRAGEGLLQRPRQVLGHVDLA